MKRRAAALEAGRTPRVRRHGHRPPARSRPRSRAQRPRAAAARTSRCRSTPPTSAAASATLKVTRDLRRARHARARSTTTPAHHARGERGGLAGARRVDRRASATRGSSDRVQARRCPHFVVLAPRALGLDTLMSALEGGYARMGDVLKKPRLRRRYLVVVAGGTQARARADARASAASSRSPRSRDAEVREAGQRAGASRTWSPQRLSWCGRRSARSTPTGSGGSSPTSSRTRRSPASRQGRTPAWLIEGIALYVSDDRRVGDAARYLAGEASGRARRALRLGALSRARRDRAASAATARRSPTPTRRRPRSTIAERFGRKRFLKLYNAFNDEYAAGPHAASTPPAAPSGARSGSRWSAARRRRARLAARPSLRTPCPSCPRSRRSAATWRPTSRAGRSGASRSTTPAGRCPLAPRGARGRAGRPPRRALGRRGKYLVWELEDEAYLLLHLRMTGTLLLDPPERAAPHARAPSTSATHRLVFVDPRRFGTGELALGPEALDGVLRRAARRRAVRRRVHRRAPARARRAGRARRSRRSCSTRSGSPASGTSTPTRRCSAPASTRCGRANRLKRKQAGALRDAVVESLSAGHRGQGRDDRRLPRPGRGQRLVPGPLPRSTCARASRACAAARPVRKLRAAGRGTYVCERCQPRPRATPASARSPRGPAVAVGLDELLVAAERLARR